MAYECWLDGDYCVNHYEIFLEEKPVILGPVSKRSRKIFEMEVLIMRRTIRKIFLLEGETVTMKYVKQLCGEERYGRMIEDAKKKFFADPTVDLCYPTPAGYLTIWFQLA